MVTFETTIQNRKIKMFSRYPFKNAAETVVKLLSQISKRTDIFTGKFSMGFGWAYFFLDRRQDENGEEFWVLQTTDFKTNPMKNKSDDVTTALLVQNMQFETISIAKVNPEAITFKDTVVVLKEAIKAEQVYLNRSKPEKEGDSGWYFGLLNDPNEDNHPAEDYIIVPSYEFLKIRIGALRLMMLPIGTVAVLNGNDITALVDKDDKPLKFLNPQKKQSNSKVSDKNSENSEGSKDITESEN